MTKIVHLSIIKQHRETSQEALWQRFADLKRRSQETLRIEDGIAAGKAYREFCESFTPRRER